MRHCIYPKSDSFITNDTSYVLKNFGADDELSVFSKSTSTSVLMLTASVQPLSASNLLICDIQGFNGFINGYISGSSPLISGSVVDC